MLAVPALAMGGWTIHRNYEYRSELSIWQTVVDRRPSNPRGYHHLASAHYKAGQLEHAYDAWLKTLELSPEGFPEAYLNLARIELDRGQIAQGRAHIAHAIVLRPDDPDFHVALGEAFLRDNDLDAAAAAFQKALELQSDRVGIAQTRARAASNLGAVRLKQRRTDEAITHLNLALELDPNLADAHANMGLALARLQRFDDAIVQLRAALVLDDTRPDIHNNLGEVLAIQRDLDRAEAHFVRALNLDPLYGAAVSNLIVLSRDYAEAGRFPEAARALEVAIIAIQSRRGDPSEWKPYVRILQAFREGHMPVFE
jgi:tetratricopeptide (TPR) repeat protein